MHRHERPPMALTTTAVTATLVMWSDRVIERPFFVGADPAEKNLQPAPVEPLRIPTAATWACSCPRAVLAMSGRSARPRSP